MSAIFSIAASNADRINTNPSLSSPPRPATTAPTYYVDDLDELMEHLVNALESMAIYSPPYDSDADDDHEEIPQNVTEAVSTVASRVTGTEDALSELVRVSFIHTNMIKSLQATNTALSEQLEVTAMRLDQMEVDLRALRDAQAFDFMPKHMLNVDDATIDAQLFGLSPEGDHHNFNNCFSTTLGPRYNSSQWMDVSTLAATLAVAPRIPSYASSASSRSSSSSYRERRPYRPQRAEHVKRSRITYDGHGGQTPNISPPVLNFKVGVYEEQKADYPGRSRTQSVHESASSGENREEDLECDEPDEPSLTSWLYGKATRALFRH